MKGLELESSDNKGKTKIQINSSNTESKIIFKDLKFKNI